MWLQVGTPRLRLKHSHLRKNRVINAAHERSPRQFLFLELLSAAAGGGRTALTLKKLSDAFPTAASEPGGFFVAANAGEEPSVILNKVKEGTGSYGYNAATGEYGDMLAMGILDPTKVTRTALQNAASIAGLMITTEAMVAEAPKKDDGGGAGGGMGGGGMGGMGGMDF